MRSRNIKPGFFTNEDLGVADPFIPLLFAGLWCLADKAGRLEDRPARIKAELFPYRGDMDVNGFLTELSRLKLIVRYSIGPDEQRYIQIYNFRKHQSPHHTEKHSVIPAINGESTVEEPLPPEAPAPAKKPKPLVDEDARALKKELADCFDDLWSIYPRKDGKKGALSHYNASVKTKEDMEHIDFALGAYLAYIKREAVELKFIKKGETWFNNWQDWTPKEMTNEGK